MISQKISKIKVKKLGKSDLFKKFALQKNMIWQYLKSGLTSTPKMKESPSLSHKIVMHNKELIDPFYGMKDTSNPLVLEYMQQENLYIKAKMSSTKKFSKKLYKEMSALMPKEEKSHPEK